VKLQDIDWPEFGLEDDVRRALGSLASDGEPAVLVTLFASDGGSPRGVGTQMLFGASEVTGYLSGGCVEADVALHAEAVMASGEPRRLVYGKGGPADVRLPCGGRIEALVERIPAGDPAAKRLLELAEARQPALWLTDGVVHACLGPGESGANLPAALQAAAGLAGRGGVCGVSAQPFALYRRFDPQRRLVVMGADPPALAMASLGAQMGFATSFLRPKGPSAPPPLPGVRYLRAEPAAALAEAGLDPWTSVAIASHDLERDEEALLAALKSEAGYVGVLGSRRRLPERLARLKARGLSEAQIARLHAPIGLPLAGKSPWEIAISVIGEVVQQLRAAEEAHGWPAPHAGAGLHAVVLAAGQASRFGAAKLTQPCRGQPVLHGALAAAFAAPVQTIVLVTGAHGEAVTACARAFAAARADGARLRIVHAPDHAQGLAASLRRGLDALPPHAEGALLFLGDMPAIPAGVAQLLADALAAGARAAAPRHHGRRGHPVAVSRSLFPELLGLEGDRGAAAVLAALGDGLCLIETPDPGVLYDIDTPQDLTRGPAPAALAPSRPAAPPSI
jgi:xanthine dehydrogenase accessory factor